MVGPNGVGRKRMRIALLVDTSMAWARDLYSGVARFGQQHGSWAILHEPGCDPFRPPSWLERFDGDGVIGQMDGPTLTMARNFACPVVALYSEGSPHPFPEVGHDQPAIGRLAFEHLHQRGVRNFAFVGVNFGWARGRQAGFVDAARAHGATVLVNYIPSLPDRTIATDPDKLQAFIASLPKPVGIMAATDLAGGLVLDAARASGATIPEEVAVVGVDNELSLCCSGDVELSSVRAESNDLGFHAAELLYGLMNGASREARQVLVPPLGVVARYSTDVIASTKDEFVAAALRYIRDHACEGISVTDVVDCVPLSRSPLHERFLKTVGRSVHQEIVRVRLERAKRLLADTELSISIIADRVAISPQRRLNTVFKSNLGVTPARYRAQAKEPFMMRTS